MTRSTFVLIFAATVAVQSFLDQPSHAGLLSVVLGGTELTPKPTADPWGLGGPSFLELELIVEMTDTDPDIALGSYPIQSVTVTINGVSETSVPGFNSVFELSDQSNPAFGDSAFFFGNDIQFNGATADIQLSTFFGEFITFSDPLENLPSMLNLSQVPNTSSSTGTADYCSASQNATMVITPVPEPTALLPLSFATAAFLLRRRRMRHPR